VSVFKNSVLLRVTNTSYLCDMFWAASYIGSLVSRVAVANTYKEIAHLFKSIHFIYRCFPGILSSYVSFYHELREWTNDTSLFRFNIREIRLFVISKHLISHHHNSSMSYLQRELPESPRYSPAGRRSTMQASFSMVSIDIDISLQIVAIWFLEDWCMFAFGYHH